MTYAEARTQEAEAARKFIENGSSVAGRLLTRLMFLQDEELSPQDIPEEEMNYLHCCAITDDIIREGSKT